MLPGKNYSFREIAAVVVRRRWFALLPLMAGLPTMSMAESGVTSMAGPLGGLAIGLLLIAVVEYSDSSLQGEEDAACTLMVPVLGMVPIISERERRRLRYRRAVIGAIRYVMVLAAIAVFVWGLLT